MDTTKVAILGTGVVGEALEAGLTARGHDVRRGGRDAFADLAAFGEVVILAIRGDPAPGVAGELAGALAGKVVIDTTNPLSYGDQGPTGMSVHGPDSLGARIQAAAPQARVVKAFNCIGAPKMVDPSSAGGDPTMFIAGDDDAAKATVSALLESLGWRSIADVGGIEASWMLEALAFLWITVGVRSGSWDHALALLRG